MRARLDDVEPICDSHHGDAVGMCGRDDELVRLPVRLGYGGHPITAAWPPAFAANLRHGCDAAAVPGTPRLAQRESARPSPAECHLLYLRHAPPVIERIADHAERAGRYSLQPAPLWEDISSGRKAWRPDKRCAASIPCGAASHDSITSICRLPGGAEPSRREARAAGTRNAPDAWACSASQVRCCQVPLLHTCNTSESIVDRGRSRPVATADASVGVGASRLRPDGCAFAPGRSAFADGRAASAGRVAEAAPA